jgi:hypothetical protein
MATAPAPQVDLSKVAETYIKIRDAKAEKKRAFEAEVATLDGQLEKLEGFMLQHLNTHGMDSVRTAGGTFYRQEDIRPNITDDVLFYGWIKDNDAFDALERRVKKTFVSEFMETHEGGLPPPGITARRREETSYVSREYVRPREEAASADVGHASSRSWHPSETIGRG